MSSSCYPAHLIVLGPATLCSMACLERGPSGAGDGDEAHLAEHTAAIAEDLRRGGAAPFLVPFGGSTPLSAEGYAEGGRELLRQLPDISTVVVAVGSGATMAGLVSVLGPERVLGVHCGAVTDPRATVARLVPATDVPIDPGVLRLDERQVGGGYGQLTDAVMDAMLTAARTEGIVLDPIYTGRAMAGLIAAVAAGEIRRGERTVFHTGGLPGVRAYSGVERHWTNERTIIRCLARDSWRRARYLSGCLADAQVDTLVSAHELSETSSWHGQERRTNRKARQVTDDGSQHRSIGGSSSRGRGWAIGHQERKSHALCRGYVGTDRASSSGFPCRARNITASAGATAAVSIVVLRWMIPCKRNKDLVVFFPQLVLTVVPSWKRIMTRREVPLGPRYRIWCTALGP
jgi:hypothetical protein